jgi:hypothetical protein
MKAQVLPLLAAICVFFYSCGSDEKISREVFEKVQQANEVKKLSEVDIFNEALRWGEEISVEAQKQLMAGLEKALEENGASGAVEFCDTQALSILQELSEQYGVTIRRVSQGSANPANQPLEEEKMLLEAYEYNDQNGIRHEPNLQKIQDGAVLLFTKAIIRPEGLCLHDHGQPLKDTPGEITPAYPEENVEGGLSGIWSIAIPQKEVVNRL